MRLEQVILPGNLKEQVVKLAKNYSSNKSKQGRVLIDKFYGYGTGLTFLFHGPSGTGKTMFAHALANSLGKELLSVNLLKAAQLSASTEELTRYVFKEAKLSDGIVFFDECDDIFTIGTNESRIILIEIEKAECITILATNNVIKLDPALDRRIILKVPFSLPHEKERELIWKALVPPNIHLSDDIDFKKLSRTYIFTGGLIKNTLFMAITNSVSKSDELRVVLTTKQIEQAAEHQAASMFNLYGFGKTYTPETSVKQLPLKHQDKEILNRLASFYKSSNFPEMTLKVVIGTSDIKTGIDCIDAIAKECELKVKKYHLSNLFNKDNASNSVRDPLTQKEMSFLDYAFRTTTGYNSLTLFVDYGSFFERFLLKDQQDWGKDVTGLFDKLRSFKGMLFLVTAPIKTNKLPIEFNHYIELHLPSEELQIRHWKMHFNKSEGIEDRIIELVERYPSHLHEIDLIVHQAKISSLLNGHDGITCIEQVYDTIGRFRIKGSTPMLFGKKIC